MIRRWVVRPDQVMISPQGDELMVCSRDATREAFLDAEAHLAHMGGVLVIDSKRVQTGFPGESMSELVVIEWKSHLVTRDRPEGRGGSLIDALTGEPDLEAATDEPFAATEEVAAEAPQEATAAGVLPFEHDTPAPAPVELPEAVVDEAGEPVEDLSSIEPHLRVHA